MKQTTTEMVEAVNAFKQGKAIQYKAHGANNWSGNCEAPAWDFSRFEYREIPEHPHKCYMVITGDDSTDTVHLTEKEAIAHAALEDRVVLMEEII